MSPPILSIVGYSNSGKTTLMEKLVTGLTAQGLRIATIKHSHHQPEMDTPGKDSWRHKQAGAVASLLVGPEKMLMVRDVRETLTPQQLAARFFMDDDLILVEGYASMRGVKIEVVRAARSQVLRCADHELLAVATDIPEFKANVPVLDLNHPEAVMDFILSWMEDIKRGDDDG